MNKITPSGRETDIPLSVRGKVHGKCGRWLKTCPKCNIASEIYADRLCLECGESLWCTNEPIDSFQENSGYDKHTNTYGMQCYDCMPKDQREAYYKKFAQTGHRKLSGKWGDIFNELARDPEFLSLDFNAKSASVYLEELMRRLSMQSPASLTWTTLGDKWREMLNCMQIIASMKAAYENVDDMGKRDAKRFIDTKEKQERLFNEIGDLISGGYCEKQLWNEINAQNKLAADLKTQETTRKISVGAMMSPEEVLAILQQTLLSMADKSKEELKRLQEEGKIDSTVSIRDMHLRIVNRTGETVRAFLNEADRFPSLREIKKQYDVEVQRKIEE